MSLFHSKEDPALQLYGKLPIAKDYLRIGCADGAARRLREWMDRSFSALEAGASPILAEPMSFLWPDGGRALLGTLWPSSDAGGLRLFPFVLFVERRWRALWDELETGMGAAERWLRTLDRLWDEARAQPDGAELLAFLRGKRIEPSAEPSAEPSRDAGVDYDRWATLLWPDGRAGLEALLAQLIRAEAGRGEALLLPMTADLPLGPQLDAWWSLLRELGRVSKKGATTLFFSRDGGGAARSRLPRLVLLAREPAPGESAWLAHPPSPLATEPVHPDPVLPLSSSGAGQSLAMSLCGTLALVRARGRGE